MSNQYFRDNIKNYPRTMNTAVSDNGSFKEKQKNVSIC